MTDRALETLTAAIAASPTIAALSATVGAALVPLGMTAYASGMVSGARSLSASPFHFVAWPDDWLRLYQAQGFVRIDPLPRWAIVSGEALAWSEVIARLPAGDPGHRVVAAARDHGFSEGFVTPVRTRAGDLGLVSVGGGARECFSPGERLTLQTLAAAAVMRAESLAAAAAPMPSVFTQREAESVALLRQGFSDPEIGRALAIAPETARFHLDNARRKLGARNRVELAVKAGAMAAG